MSRRLAAIVIAALLASPALADEDPAHVEVTTTRVLQSDTLPPLDRARTLVTRGLARETLHRPKDAYDDFAYALSLHALPMDEIARARYDRGVVLEEMGRNDEALADYTAAINLEPRFAAGLNNRANLYRRLGRLDDAARDYNASLGSGNAQPEYPLYGLGQISEALGRADTARAYYQQALATNPHFDLAAQRLAVLNGPQPLPPLPPMQPRAEANPVTVLKPPKDVQPPPRKYGPLPMEPAPVQLGAFRDEAMARTEWDKIVARLGDLFAGFSPHILPLDQGAERLYRLQAGPFARPRDICKAVRAAGFGCFPARDPESLAAAVSSP